MRYGYIRVSSDKQTVENQRFEIEQFCLRQGMRVDGQGDLIICSELSRLGRSLYMIMEILSLCMNRSCSVWTIKDGYRLGDDIQSKVLAFAFGLSAEIERNLISQRTREALARLKAEGKHIGRPAGSHNRPETHPQQGTSQRALALRLHCSRNTLRRFIAQYITP